MELDSINAIGLQNYGISGTVFLASLLDGHPNIAALPGIGTREFYPFWQSVQKLSDLAKIDVFIERHRFWFDRTAAAVGGLGPDKTDVATADPDTFRKIAVAALPDMPLTGGQFLALVSVAYNQANGRDLATPLFVLFHIHSAPLTTVEPFYADFPRAKTVYLLRNLAGNYASLARQYSRQPAGPKNIVECVFGHLLENRPHYTAPHDAYGDRPHFERVRQNCGAIRLEDIHQHPRETLGALCRWIGIPWHDSLMQSTFDGKAWWNKGRTAGVEINGFDPALPFRGIDNEMSRTDRIRLELLAARKLRLWGYGTPLKWLPSAVREKLLLRLARAPFKIEGQWPDREQYLRRLFASVESEGPVEVKRIV